MQSEFGFVEDVTVRVRKAVCTLMRFKPSGEFNDAVTYGQWLSWYSPLNGGWA